MCNTVFSMAANIPVYSDIPELIDMASCVFEEVVVQEEH